MKIRKIISLIITFIFTIPFMNLATLPVYAISNGGGGANTNLAWKTATSSTNAINGKISNLAYGNGVFVATNSSGNMIVSQDNGQTWSATGDASFKPNTINYDGHNFVAAGNGVKTSSDGINWGDNSTVINGTIYYMTSAYTSKGYVTIACGGHDVWMSNAFPGYTVPYGWRKLYDSNPNHWYMYYTGFVYVPAHQIDSFNIPEGFYGLASGNVLCEAPDATSISYSPGGSYATEYFDGPITYDGIQTFYCPGAGGQYSTTNPWRGWHFVAGSVITNGQANGAGTSVSVGNNGFINGGGTSQNIGSANLNEVIFADGIFVVVGDYGRILTSSDGSTWHTCISGTTKNLSCVAYANGTFVVGGDGIILYSATPTTPAVPTGIKAAAGDGKVILTWDANSESDLKGYNVDYIPAGGSEKTQFVTTNSCTISGLTDGTEYAFKINATSIYGLTSDYSTPVTATPQWQPTVATPQANPKGGTVANGTQVVLTTTTAGATIYYTTNESTPSPTNGTKYTVPITINGWMTIEAIAVKDGMNDSGLMSEYYSLIEAQALLGDVSDMWGHTYNVKLQYTPNLSGPTSNYQYIVSCNGLSAELQGSDDFKSFFQVLLWARQAYGTDKTASQNYANQAYSYFENAAND